MTPNKFLLAVVSTLMLIGLNAEAQFGIGPLPPPGGGGVVPGPARPVPPPPPGHPGHGYRESKVIHLNRYITNETLPLRQLAGLGGQYQGYSVESVQVQSRPTGYRAHFDLLLNGRVEASAPAGGPQVMLRPRGPTQLGWDVQALRLRVQGTAFVDRIVITVVQDSRPGPGPGPRPPVPPRPPTPPPHPGEIVVPLQVNYPVYGNGHIELGHYVNVQAYRGYQVMSVEVQGRPSYNNVLVDFLVNGYPAGSAALDRYSNRVMIRPHRHTVIGFDHLALQVRGEGSIHTVLLRLRR